MREEVFTPQAKVLEAGKLAGRSSIRFGEQSLPSNRHISSAIGNVGGVLRYEILLYWYSCPDSIEVCELIKQGR